MAEEIEWFVGIDWADQKHVWCWQAADTGQCESGELEHKPEVVEAWVSELCQRFGHGPIAVAVEQVKGALVYMLRKYECLHLYPVPSTMSASMRESVVSLGREGRSARCGSAAGAACAAPGQITAFDAG